MNQHPPHNNEQPTLDNSPAMDRLVEQDRIVSTEAIMLPIETELTAEQHQSVRHAVNDFTTDDKGERVVALNKIAKECGLSASIVSEFMKDRYKGDNDRVARALNLWLDRHVKRSRSQGRRVFVDTWVASEMAAMVRLADRRQKMAAIVSPSGSGKDMVIAALADELDGIVIYCDASTTATRLVQAIATDIGVPVIGETYKLKQRVIQRLKDRSVIILINEAQQMSRAGTGARCASILRSIFDQTGVPIVLFGSAEVFAFVDDRDPASGGGQLYRRCMKLNIINRARVTNDPDRPGQVGRPLFSKEEVKRFLAMKRVKLTGDVFRLMWHVANLTEHGTLGLCGDVIETIADLWSGDKITTEHVYSALALLLDSEADVIQARIESNEAEIADAATAMAG